jgi:hypothetical protein
VDRARLVTFQLRIYTVRAGEMEKWLAEWRTHVLPLRRKFGFEVVGPWVIDDEDRFVWILGHEGDRSWSEADAAYYGSEERRSIEPDPARRLAKIETWMMSSA